MTDMKLLWAAPLKDIGLKILEGFGSYTIAVQSSEVNPAIETKLSS